MKQMTSPSSMHEPGRSKPVNWANPEGGMGRQVGGGLGQGDTCTPVADPRQRMAKTTSIL